MFLKCMKYLTDLSIRLGLALAILLIPYDIFYHLLLTPTLFLSQKFIENASIAGSIIQVPGYNLNLISACIGSIAYVLLILLILTTKGINLGKRIIIFLTGGIILFIVNTLRIIILGNIIQNNYAQYQNWHLLIWNFASTIFVALLWILLTYLYHIHNIPVVSDFKKLKKYLKKTKEQ